MTVPLHELHSVDVSMWLKQSVAMFPHFCNSVRSCWVMCNPQSGSKIGLCHLAFHVFPLSTQVFWREKEQYVQSDKWPPSKSHHNRVLFLFQFWNPIPAILKGYYFAKRNCFSHLQKVLDTLLASCPYYSSVQLTLVDIQIIVMTSAAAISQKQFRIPRFFLSSPFVEASLACST